MTNILNKYIKKSILSKIFIVFLILIALSSIIKLFEELRSFEKKNVFIFDVFICTVLNLPKEFDLLLPIATLLGGLLGLSVLEIRYELIVMQIAGLNKMQIALPVIEASIFIFLLSLLSNEWLLPYSQKLIRTYQDHKQYNTYLFPEKNKNLWLKDNQNFIFIRKMLTHQELLGVNVYSFTKNERLHKILYIERAIYSNQNWLILNITALDFSKNMSIFREDLSNQIWNTSLTPKFLSKITLHPKILSISDIKYCIKCLNKMGQNYKYYQLIFWNKITSSFTGIVMIITALTLFWGPFHQKKTSIKLFFGSITGFLLYISHPIFGVLSMTYCISPIIGATGPIIFLLIINVVILWKYI